MCGDALVHIISIIIIICRWHTHTDTFAHISTHTQAHRHTHSRPRTHTSGMPQYPANTNKKIKSVMSLWFLPCRALMPITGYWSIISGGKRKIKWRQKNHHFEKATQGWRAGAESHRGREERDWCKEEKAAERELKLQPDSTIYIEAFVKMPHKPELVSKANYKSPTRTYICTFTHMQTCTHTIKVEKNEGKRSIKWQWQRERNKNGTYN